MANREDRKQTVIRAAVAAMAVVALAALGAVGLYLKSEYDKAEYAEQVRLRAAAAPPVKVLVAARDLAFGHIVATADLDWREFRNTEIEPGFFAVTGKMTAATLLEEALGSVVKSPLKSGQPVTQNNVLAPFDPDILSDTAKSQ